MRGVITRVHLYDPANNFLCCDIKLSKGEEMIYINEEGFSETQGTAPIPEHIEICTRWIQEMCTKTQGLNPHMDSYGLKGRVERSTGQYVTNGAFIFAAIALGYKYKRFDLNADFNLKIH